MVPRRSNFNKKRHNEGVVAYGRLSSCDAALYIAPSAVKSHLVLSYWELCFLRFKFVKGNFHSMLLR